MFNSYKMAIFYFKEMYYNSKVYQYFYININKYIYITLIQHKFHISTYIIFKL